MDGANTTEPAVRQTLVRLAQHARRDDPNSGDLEALQQDLLRAVRQANEARDVHPAVAFSLPVLQCAQEVEAAVDHPLLHDAIVCVVLYGLQATSGELPGPQRQVAEFLAGSFLSLLAWWLRDAPHLPPEAVDEVYRALAMGGLNG